MVGALAFSGVFLFAAAVFSARGTFVCNGVFLFYGALLGEAIRLVARGNQCGANNDER